MPQDLIDDELLPRKRKKVRALPKIIRWFLLIASAVLHFLNLFNVFFWLLSARYLGWLPSYGHPAPKALAYVFSYGQASLKELVLKWHDWASVSIRIMLWAYLVSINLMIISVVITGIQRFSRLQISAVIAIAVATYLIFGGYFEWILD